MALPLNLEREELEEFVEAKLVEIAETLIPHEPGEEDLKAAYDYLPQFFGGEFPTLGLTVMRTEGHSAVQSKPHRPGLLGVYVMIYEPCMPFKGALTPQQDRTGPAKRLTRRIRGRFLKEVMNSSIFRGATEIRQSRASPYDEAGNPIADEIGRDDRSLLWADRTELFISA